MCGRYLIDIDDNELYEIIAEAEMNAGMNAGTSAGSLTGMAAAEGAGVQSGALEELRTGMRGSGARRPEPGGLAASGSVGRVFSGGEIFPGSAAPVITPDNSARFMLWGYPSAVSGRRPHINARSETAATARTFSAAMASRRCLVPASGYYEWKTLGQKKKVKYEFTLPGRVPIYMAGIYSADERFAILTRDAAPGLTEIHDRMPVILPKERADVWLNGSQDVFAHALTSLLFSPAL